MRRGIGWDVTDSMHHMKVQEIVRELFFVVSCFKIHDMSKENISRSFF